MNYGESLLEWFRCWYKDGGGNKIITEDDFDSIEYAINKQIPKKPIRMKNGSIVCPECEQGVLLNLTSGGGYDLNVDHCTDCGQRILWEEVK